MGMDEERALQEQVAALERKMDAGFARLEGRMTRIMLGDLDDPNSRGGFGGIQREHAKQIADHNERIAAMEDTMKKLGDWIQDRSTIEGMGKWIIGGGGVAVGVLVAEIFRLILLAVSQ